MFDGLVEQFGNTGAYGLIILGVMVILWAFREWRFHMTVKNLEELVVRYPNYADIRAKLADAYLKRGYVDKAEYFYRDALKIYPYYSYARFKLGLLYRKENRLEEMFEQFSAILEHEHEDESLRKIVEDAIFEAGMWEKYEARQKAKNAGSRTS